MSTPKGKGIWMPEGVPRWPVAKLKPYKGNPRTHSADQIERIASSIIERGFVNPVLVDAKGGVIAGHGRLMAAKQLGMREIPVIELAHLTKPQRRALMIADNKLALDAGWDEGLLIAELRALEADGLTLEAASFTDEELKEMEVRLQIPDGTGETADDSSGLGKPVISYTIIFDNHGQQDEWFAFLRWLKKAPGAEETTLAGRLIAYLRAVSDTRS